MLPNGDPTDELTKAVVAAETSEATPSQMAGSYTSEVPTPKLHQFGKLQWSPSNEQLSRVPQVTLVFWVVKCLCTALGETLADQMNISFGEDNYSQGKALAVYGMILFFFLCLQFWLCSYFAPVYWACILLISICGTLVTDIMADIDGIQHNVTTAIFASLLGATFVVWYIVEKTLSIHSIYSARREMFYWMVVFFTIAYVLTRPLGASVGDLLTAPKGNEYALDSCAWVGASEEDTGCDTDIFCITPYYLSTFEFHLVWDRSPGSSMFPKRNSADGPADDHEPLLGGRSWSSNSPFRSADQYPRHSVMDIDEEREGLMEDWGTSLAMATAGAPDSSLANATSGALGGRMKWRSHAATPLNKSSSIARPFNDLHLPGKAQGIDVKRGDVELDRKMASHLHACVNITVVDYCQSQVKVHPDFGNDGLKTFFEEPRPEWAKVRWINIEGMSWDVISTLAHEFDLHPLAVEDAVHIPQRIKFDLHPLAVEDAVHIPQRIKVDFYESFLYLSLVVASVRSTVSRGGLGGRKGSPEYDPLQDEQASVDDDHGSVGGSVQGSATGATGKAPLHRLASRNTKTNAAHLINEVVNGGMVRSRSQRGMASAAEAASAAALLRAGGSSQAVAAPSRFGQEEGDAPSSLRKRHNLSNNALLKSHSMTSSHSLNGQGPVRNRPEMPDRVLDIFGEQASIFLMRDGTIISMYEQSGQAVTQPILEQILEGKTLARERGTGSGQAENARAKWPRNDTAHLRINPGVGDVGKREGTSGDIGSGQAENARAKWPSSDSAHLGANPGVGDVGKREVDLSLFKRTMLPMQNAVSSLVKHVDNGDTTLDHLSTILENMEGLFGQCRDLINLVFNLISHQTNNSMQTLSVVSALQIFLPFTLLAVVCGMNFTALSEESLEQQNLMLTPVLGVVVDLPPNHLTFALWLIFLPITFLAGVYGMNFELLPEIKWTYGYMYFWLMCLVVSTVFLILLRRMGMLRSYS
eukprot:gene16298-22486_t